jgi:TonB family protein
MKNIKVMNTKPEVTDEEINSLMNFDALLQQHEKTIKKSSNGKFTVSVIAFSTVIIASLIYWFAIRSENESAIIETEKAPWVENKRSSTDLLIRIDSVDNTSSSTRSPKKHEAKQSIKKPEHDNTRNVSSEVAKDEEKVIEKIPASVFVQAEPIAGYPDLYEYFNRELTYPRSRMRDSVSGVVAVVFTINKEGHPEKIEIEQSLGKEFDEEAIRVMQNMPPWNPATYNGKPVTSRMSLPLTFQVRKIK